MNRTPILLPVCVFALSAAAALTATAAPPAPSASGLDLAGLDRSVRPGDDFFRYANGSWTAANEIPPDRSSWGSAEILDDLTRKRTSDLIQSAGKGAAPGSEAYKVGAYYSAYMDEATIEAAGLTPLQPQLARIDAIKDRASLARVLGATLRADVDVLNSTNLHTENLFGLWVAQDLSNPKRYLPFLLQGGLVMPDRDYYLNDSQKMADIRVQYQTHITKVLMLAQIDQAAARGARVLDL
jgi:putative endopeptidase